MPLLSLVVLLLLQSSLSLPLLLISFAFVFDVVTAADTISFLFCLFSLAADDVYFTIINVDGRKY